MKFVFSLSTIYNLFETALPKFLRNLISVIYIFIDLNESNPP